jgi:hypothetical protein
LGLITSALGIGQIFAWRSSSYLLAVRLSAYGPQATLAALVALAAINIILAMMMLPRVTSRRA